MRVFALALQTKPGRTRAKVYFGLCNVYYSVCPLAVGSGDRTGDARMFGVATGEARYISNRQLSGQDQINVVASAARWPIPLLGSVLALASSLPRASPYGRARATFAFDPPTTPSNRLGCDDRSGGSQTNGPEIDRTLGAGDCERGPHNPYL